jgi:hypothetical protein
VQVAVDDADPDGQVLDQLVEAMAPLDLAEREAFDGARDRANFVAPVATGQRRGPVAVGQPADRAAQLRQRVDDGPEHDPDRQHDAEADAAGADCEKPGQRVLAVMRELGRERLDLGGVRRRNRPDLAIELLAIGADPVVVADLARQLDTDLAAGPDDVAAELDELVEPGQRGVEFVLPAGRHQRLPAFRLVV